MPYSFREIKKRLRKLGFIIARQTGSHVIFYHESSRKKIVVPAHGSRDISIGIEKQILKKLEMTDENFRNLK